MNNIKQPLSQYPKKENEPSEPIDKPGEVPASNDEKIDQDFPGYPHYPAKEDILNPDNDTKKVDVDVENITRYPGQVRLQEKQQIPNSVNNENVFGDNYNDDDLGIVEGTEADVTDEDIMILESVEGNIIRAKEEDLVTTDSLSDINDEDLDLPGTELDDANENMGEEDEENNYYSIGGEREDSLENNHE